MSEDSPSAVLDRVENRYRVRFAGHARVSRDPDEIQQMLDDLAGIRVAATADPALAERLNKAVESYTNEKAAIEAAQAVPGALQGHRMRQWADLCMTRYKLGFAGKDRRTRDVQLLEDIRSHLRDVRTHMQRVHDSGPHLQLEGALRAVEGALEMYATETTTIRGARRNGIPMEQGTRLAGLANDQFELYRTGFAGHSRASRHIPRLQRIIRALEEIGGAMAQLQRNGFRDSNNDRNLGIVAERTKAYNAELVALTKAQAEASVPDRVNALGAAANKVFEAYREEFAGHSRDTRDEGKLELLFELLWSIALEMDAIDREEGHETNARNLSLVLDNLVLYQREWEAIRASKSDVN